MRKCRKGENCLAVFPPSLTTLYSLELQCQYPRGFAGRLRGTSNTIKPTSNTKIAINVSRGGCFWRNLVELLLRIFAMTTKALAVISIFACLLAGCADTPENRGLAQALAAGMHSAGQAMADDAAEQRRALRQNAQQQQLLLQNELYRPSTNCVTRYYSITGEYITQCN